MNIKKAFSLIEIIIVIMVISLLLGIGFRLNQNSINTLKTKTIEENISTEFDKLFLQINNSNYIQSGEYTKLRVNFSGGTNQIPYFYLKKENTEEEIILSGFINGQFILEKIRINDEEKKNLSVEYTPFGLDCILEENNENTHADIQFRTNGSENICFMIKKDYCKFEKKKCKLLIDS